MVSLDLLRCARLLNLINLLVDAQTAALIQSSWRNSPANGWLEAEVGVVAVARVNQLASIGDLLQPTGNANGRALVFGPVWAAGRFRQAILDSDRLNFRMIAMRIDSEPLTPEPETDLDLAAQVDNGLQLILMIHFLLGLPPGGLPGGNFLAGHFLGAVPRVLAFPLNWRPPLGLRFFATFKLPA